MNNIFENAYFSKAYRTKDGHKGIAIEIFDDCVCLAFEKLGCHYYHKDGEVFGAKSLDNMNIVSEWQEEVNEEELDELATIEGAKAISHFVNREQSKKAGYHKALENEATDC